MNDSQRLGMPDWDLLAVRVRILIDPLMELYE